MIGDSTSEQNTLKDDFNTMLDLSSNKRTIQGFNTLWYLARNISNELVVDHAEEIKKGDFSNKYMLVNEK